MKNIFLFVPLLFLIACGENKPPVNVDSLKTDSALRAQQAMTPVAVNPDTTHAIALPPVFEGDIVMQISENPQHLAFGKADKPKNNHA